MRTKFLIRTAIASCAVLVLSLLLAGGARADNLQDRVTSGSQFAASRGTWAGLAVLDRSTGQYRDNGGNAHTQVESASVMKVFIADSVLRRQDAGQISLSPQDWAGMNAMLRSSDNGPANAFWTRFGANAIVSDVASRYGLAETAGTLNTRYWGNTRITAHDMVVYYQGLINETGGLSSASTRYILDQLWASTPRGSDGDWQYFGLRDGLPRESVIGQKQGWMCCVNGNIYRHSTGFVGPDARFIVVALTREPSGAGVAHIEASISGAVRAMFPEGSIPRVQNAIADAWYRGGGASGRLGMPVTDELATADRRGAYQWFQRGAVYWSGATGAHSMVNGILDSWVRQGYETGPLGYPATDEFPTPDGRGAYSWFQHGAVYWSAQTGAHWVVNAVADAWARSGYEQGVLGYPVTDELQAAGGRGVHGWFQRGAVYWSPASGAHFMTGAVLDSWVRQGYETGPLGFPVTDEAATPDGGRMVWAQGGAVYSSSRTGAHWMSGAILDTWARQGYEAGPLGYPTSDPRTSGGTTRVDFERGSISVDRTGAVTQTSTAAARTTSVPTTAPTTTAPEPTSTSSSPAPSSPTTPAASSSAAPSTVPAAPSSTSAAPSAPPTPSTPSSSSPPPTGTGSAPVPATP